MTEQHQEQNLLFERYRRPCSDAERESLRDYENVKLFKSWPTDGVVAKVFDQKMQRKLGAGFECPNWAIALKNNGIA